jgi:hypothetical protein
MLSSLESLDIDPTSGIVGIIDQFLQMPDNTVLLTAIINIFSGIGPLRGCDSANIITNANFDILSSFAFVTIFTDTRVNNDFHLNLIQRNILVFFFLKPFPPFLDEFL